MAKGDHKRAQDMIYGYQKELGGRQNSINQGLDRANSGFQGAYDRSMPDDFRNYDSIMNNYNTMFNNPMNPQMSQQSFGGPRMDPSGYSQGMMNGSVPNKQMLGYNGRPGNMGYSPSIMPGGDRGNMIPSQGFGPSSNSSPQAFEQFIREYQASNSSQGNPGQIRDNIIKAAAERGINLSPHMTDGGVPSNNEIMTPYGEKYKVLSGEGGSNQGWYNSSMDDGGGMDTSLNSMGMGRYPGALDEAFGGYSDFAKTGGFSPQDLQDLRSRGESQTRSIYSSANANLDRNRNLQGGYSPNYNAAKAKMARDMSQALGDRAQSTNADIAMMRNQGRLSGLGGLSSLGTFGAGMSNNNALQQMQTRAQILGGMTDLYGTRPGRSSTYGDQLINSGGNLVRGQEVQGQNAGRIIGGINESSNIPGNFQSAIGNIGSAVGLGASLVSPISSVYNAARGRA